MTTMKFHFFFFCWFRKLLHNSPQTFRSKTNTVAKVSPRVWPFHRQTSKRNMNSLSCPQKKRIYWILVVQGTTWYPSPIYRYKWRIGQKEKKCNFKFLSSMLVIHSMYSISIRLFDRSFSRFLLNQSLPLSRQSPAKSCGKNISGFFFGTLFNQHNISVIISESLARVRPETEWESVFIEQKHLIHNSSVWSLR